MSSSIQQIPTTACSCGRQHDSKTICAKVVQDAPMFLAQLLQKQQHCGRILVVCDPTTYEILGKQTVASLQKVYEVDLCILQNPNLHADESAIGAVLMEVKQDTNRLVAVGSGTINDITRYIAARTSLPYDILGTAPSMDGYASTVSPLLRRGFKITFEAVAPQNILLDLTAMSKAPLPMIAAGLGDVLGKYTALADWYLAKELLGEYYCEQTVATMRRAVDLCVDLAPSLPLRLPEGIQGLGEGLILAGVAMQMVGNSRPASGAEHHIAHFWEMRQLLQGKHPTMHGDKVGFATLLVMSYYGKFFAKQRPFATIDPVAWEDGLRSAYGKVAKEVLSNVSNDTTSTAPILARCLEKWEPLALQAQGLASQRDTLAALLATCHGPTTAKELGLTKDDVRDALYYAMEIRPRFTILRLAFAWGVHIDICEEILQELGEEFSHG